MSAVLEKIDFKLNIPQLTVFRAKQRVKVMEFGRGTGKSAELSCEIIDLAHDMPRGLFVIVGETFQQILTRTLPGTKHALEMQGYYEGIHFFIGKKAPAKLGWPLPYKSPFKWEYAIHWYTGAAFSMISQDRKGNGVGLNTDGVIADELALLDEDELSRGVLLTNRGSNFKRFKDNRRFRSVIMASSTPLTAKGRFMFKFEEAALSKPNEYLYVRADARFNMDNLPEDYFDSAKLVMPEYLYNAEMLNIRLRAVQDGFYPLLNSNVHYYTDYNYTFYEDLGYGLDIENVNCLGDNDRISTKPLEITIDWGANINSLAVTQENGKVFKFLKSMYVLYPQILDDLAMDFVRYYAPHHHKECFMYYDKTGDHRLANSRKNMAQQFADILRKFGWTVHVMSHGEVEALHESKHMLWNLLLSEKEKNAPVIRFNKNNCKELIISMEQAEAYQNTKDEIKKDKRPEKNKALNQAHTTHLSDAADVIIWRKYKHLLTGHALAGREFLPSFM